MLDEDMIGQGEGLGFVIEVVFVNFVNYDNLKKSWEPYSWNKGVCFVF